MRLKPSLAARATALRRIVRGQYGQASPSTVTSQAKRASSGCHGTRVYDDVSGTASMSGEAGVWPIGPAAKPAKPAPSSSRSSIACTGISLAFGLPCISTNCARKNWIPSSFARLRTSSCVMACPPVMRVRAGEHTFWLKCRSRTCDTRAPLRRSHPRQGSTANVRNIAREQGTLSRETNWWGAFVIGLAGTILIIGLVGFALVALGGAAIPLFAILTAVGVVLCFCLAELAAMMPDRAGGLPSYAFETFRPLGDWWGTHVGGLSSWAYWLGWFTVAPINAILAANYIIALFSIKAGSSRTFGPISSGFGAEVSLTQFVVGALILLVMFIPCLLGIRLGATFATRARHRLDDPARPARPAAVPQAEQDRLRPARRLRPRPPASPAAGS